MEEKIINGEIIEKDQEQSRTLILIIWIAMLAGFLTGGFSSAIAVMIAHIKKDPQNTVFEKTHYSYLIKTFWWTMLWCVISTILAFIFIGFIGYFIVTLWFIYRCVNGIIKSNDYKII